MAYHQPHRPLSPHLQVYRLPLVAIVSISHRISGVVLSAGLVILLGFLWGIAFGGAEPAAPYPVLRDLLDGWFGRIFWVVLTFAFFFHMGNGMRHLFWDIGKGFALCTARASAVAVLVWAVGATAVLWGVML